MLRYTCPSDVLSGEGRCDLPRLALARSFTILFQGAEVRKAIQLVALTLKCHHLLLCITTRVDDASTTIENSIVAKKS